MATDTHSAPLRSAPPPAVFVAVCCVVWLAFSGSAVADKGGDTDQSPDAFTPPVQGGTFDITTSFGIDNWIYLYAELGADVGLFPIGEYATLTVGGHGRIASCVACRMFDIVPYVDSVRAGYDQALLRSAAHFNFIGRAFNRSNLDVYVGGMGGISQYRVRIATDIEANAGKTLNAIVAGPYVGMRVTAAGHRGFMLFVEGRYLGEIGQRELFLELGDEDEGIVLDTARDVRRSDLNLMMGMGIRF